MNTQKNEHFISYQAVSCEMHSELELAIMHGKCINIHYQNDTEKEVIETQLTPQDIITRSHKTDQFKHQPSGEFLLGIDSTGKALEIRLDFIISYSLSTNDQR
ncbi:MAG: hypothetical protein KZQ74_11580 [gamma proteobacterium symbiont of Bathyaustriella thionipta]|nr:hypothetical protein [gamma proteobacterium symbiont of Bathyaustriella thionipta]MCU7951554.1 hypothetical protein [gamma proteobacterium symbiont of Bathyaustriella thionipta]MCU7958150.1 hypothetical protein [gamma proteobacterium symbiont of Bathyaustriella thionipta]MCU7967814.1 hypothetical protein [gamma proteobacterium symbiont of Bathyaustriella thionipta]